MAVGGQFAASAAVIQRKQPLAHHSKHKKCCLDTSLAVAKFGEDSCNPIAGKNVLIIGASKGIGLGSAEAFIAAGANVIGTSRKPSDYPSLTFLDPVPLDLTDDASVSNFFATSQVSSWSQIDILILGGLQLTTTTLAFSKASDLFPFINTEILGRQRVVSQAIQKMKDIDDSRIIMLSSLATFVPLINAGGYGLAKAAETAWVKQWNLERLWYKKLNGGVDVIKTKAIAWQASFIDTSLGDWPPTLCPNPGDPVIGFGQMGSGMLAPYLEPSMQGQGVYFGNSSQQNLTKEEAGQAMLYLATVEDPEWQYVVMSENEEWCVGDLDCLMQKFIQHKSKDALTKALIDDVNYNAIYNNILNQGNSQQYSFYRCPPRRQSAPATPVPAFRPCYPNCVGSPPCGPDPTPFIYNFTLDQNVQDLTNNPCQNSLPCP